MMNIIEIIHAFHLDIKCVSLRYFIVFLDIFHRIPRHFLGFLEIFPRFL